MCQYIQTNKIKQSNRLSIQTNAKGSIHLALALALALVKASSVQTNKRQTKANRKWANKFKQTNQAIEQIKQTKSTSGSVSCSFARRFVQRGFPA
jgi:hypothetical protein